MRGTLGRVGLGLLAALALVLTFGPRERLGVLPDPAVPPMETPEATVGPVLRAEAFIPALRPELAKEVVWAHEDRRRTPLSVIYVHGFSASKVELQPLPAEVAAALGANLFLTRLAGHGADGPALGQARAMDWMADMAEALEVGRALGERVLVIATSTGGALAALAAAEPGGQDRVAGYVLVSPNFGLQATGAHLLTLPFARWWAPIVLGPERSWTPVSVAQAAGWTTRYPTEALAAMAAVAEAAALTVYEGVTAPALFLISDADRVVDPAAAREVAGRWGAGATVVALTPGPRDDVDAHVLAGEILSPELSPVARAAVLNWVAARDLVNAPLAAPRPPVGDLDGAPSR